MIFNKVIRALNRVLSGGAALHAEIKPHLNRNGHAPADLIDTLAARVAKRYAEKSSCKATRTETGWRFETADGKRHGGASQFWLREIRRYDRTPKSKRGGATSQHKDAVTRVLEAYKALTASEKRRFKALI